MPRHLENQFVFRKEFWQSRKQSYMKKTKENKDEDNNDGGHLLIARKHFNFTEKKVFGHWKDYINKYYHLLGVE